MNEEIIASDQNFIAPSTIHLISGRGIDVSKSDLNGILGTGVNSIRFKVVESKIRELIFFSNNLTDLEHSNMVKSLMNKWNIPRKTQLIFTNLFSSYGGNIKNVIDGNQSTFFHLNNSPQNAVSGKILFEYQQIANSVLEPYSYLSSALGASTLHNRLVLKTGYNTSDETLKAPVKIELLRKVDIVAGNNHTWYTLTNVAAHNSNGAKNLYFDILDPSNDFLGYRIVATGNVNTGNWLQINDFIPTYTVSDSPSVISLANDIPSEGIYNTNYALLSNVFTNTLIFDQDVYGLSRSDLEINNGILQDFIANNLTNYTLVIKPLSFQHSSVGQHPFLTIFLPEASASNFAGNFNNSYTYSIPFKVHNPFGRAEFDVGTYSTPTFVDLDRDGDQDVVSGEENGGFSFFSNTGTNYYTVYHKNNSASPFHGAAFDVGTYSTPTFVDLDGDGDQDLISGENDGNFWFFSNTGLNTYTVYDTNSTNNPFVGNRFVSSSPTFSDLDGDGDQDMISGSTSGILWFYSNSGTNSYTIYNYQQTGSPVYNILLGYAIHPIFIDFDNDGDDDIVNGISDGGFIFLSNTGSFGTNLYVFYNTNDLANPFHKINFNMGFSISCPTLVDFDGDGDLDLLSGERYGRFFYFMNVGGNFLRAD